MQPACRYDLYDLRPAVTVVTGAAARTRRARVKPACRCDAAMVPWNAQPRGRGDVGARVRPAARRSETVEQRNPAWRTRGAARQDLLVQARGQPAGACEAQGEEHDA